MKKEEDEKKAAKLSQAMSGDILLKEKMGIWEKGVVYIKENFPTKNQKVGIRTGRKDSAS